MAPVSGVFLLPPERLPLKFPPADAFYAPLLSPELFPADMGPGIPLLALLGVFAIDPLMGGRNRAVLLLICS